MMHSSLVKEYATAQATYLSAASLNMVTKYEVQGALDF
jgi:hypothetical protein